MSDVPRRSRSKSPRSRPAKRAMRSKSASPFVFCLESCGCGEAPSPLTPSRKGRGLLREGWGVRLIPAVGQQDLAFALMVRLADHAVLFHALYQPRGAVIADLQTALDVRGGDFALACDDRDRFVVEIVAAFAAHPESVGIILIFVGLFGDGFEIFGVSLRL